MDFLNKKMEEMTNDELSTLVGAAKALRMNDFVIQLQEELRNRGVESDEYKENMLALKFLVEQNMKKEE